MKLSDYIAEFMSSICPHVFGVCGGGAMYLNDSIAHHSSLKWVATHHEQAAAFAAEAYARVTNDIGVVHVTAGPGVTNAITGVACAYADSLPMLVVAGQVDSSTLKSTNIRQLGISEVDGVALMRPVTKYAVTVKHPETVVYYMQKAYYQATHGRKGPVFVEIPLDVQNAEIDPENLTHYVPISSKPPSPRAIDIAKCIKMLQEAKRPVLLIGNGVRLSGAEEELATFVSHGPQIPILCSWSGADLISSDHPRYVGRPGLIGDRAGNFAVQMADLIIAVGTRLSIPQVGHNWLDFGRNAKLIMVDVDEDETNKKTLKVDLPIVADAGYFLEQLAEQCGDMTSIPPWEDWVERCRSWRKMFPAIDPAYKNITDGVHAYHFLERLAAHLDEDAIIVTDVGTSFVSTMQAMPMTGKQRMFHSPGIAPMGYGLPGAIGAAFAAPGRQIICLTGDGGTMFNLQELQTIVNYKLPIAIVVYDNFGYKTMQTTQGNHFRREAVSSSASGLSWPNFLTLASAFGIPQMPCYGNPAIDVGLNITLKRARAGPALLNLALSRNQLIAPVVKTRVENGRFVPVQLEDMWPHLLRDEYFKNVDILG